MAQKQISVEQAFEMVVTQTTQREYDKARELLGKILRAQPDNEKARVMLKNLPGGDGGALKAAQFKIDMKALLSLYAEEDASVSLERARHLTKLYPSQPMPMNILGALLIKQGNLEESVSIINSALELSPDYADAWNNLGCAQLELDDPSAALVSFSKAIELEQSESVVATAEQGRGRAYAMLGHYPDARVSFNACLFIRPNDGATRTALARVLRQLGDSKGEQQELMKAISSEPSYATAYLELGVVLTSARQYEAAKHNLIKAIDLEDTNPRAYLKLGVLLARMEDSKGAAAAYRRCLALDPGSEEALLLLDAVEGSNAGRPAAPDYLIRMFDQYAESFERSLVERLGYRGPANIFRLIDALAPKDSVFCRAIDLGCGTGLMGPLLRPRVKHLTGVDLSEKMLAKADEKQVYDTLVASDIVSALHSSPEDFDLVIVLDVLLYIGDLAPLMSALRENTTKGALVALSTEHSDLSDGFELRTTCRYAYSKRYVIDASATAELVLASFEESPLRREDGEWVNGGFYVFRRT